MSSAYGSSAAASLLRREWALREQGTKQDACCPQAISRKEGVDVIEDYYVRFPRLLLTFSVNQFSIVKYLY